MSAKHDPKTVALLALNDATMSDDPVLASTARLLRDLGNVTENWLKDEYRRTEGNRSPKAGAIIIQSYCTAVGVCAGASLASLIKPGGEAPMAAECAGLFAKHMLELIEIHRKEAAKS